MTLIEIVTAGAGLGIGYLAVAFLLGAKKPPGQAGAGTQEAPAQQERSAPHWASVLGVEPSATTDQIREAYRRLMSQYHPDKVAPLGAELRELAERKSKEITGAYQQAMSERGAAS